MKELKQGEVVIELHDPLIKGLDGFMPTYKKVAQLNAGGCWKNVRVIQSARYSNGTIPRKISRYPGSDVVTLVGEKLY